MDKITGLSPVISIEQKTTSKNPRSTVGTITEIYDFLSYSTRGSYAYSYKTGEKMISFSDEEIISIILNELKTEKRSFLHLVRARKGHYRELFEQYPNKDLLR